jgi:CDP-glycerol glycerophosphotransferase (TagB/SpsB family)
MTVCDYVISDYSALLVDASVCNIKILMYLYDFDEYSKNNGVNLDFFKDFKHLSYKDGSKLMEVINKDKYDLKEFEEFRKLYTVPEDMNCTKELVNLIKSSLK